MKDMGRHASPVEGTVTANGHALVPFTIPPPLQAAPRWPVSALPQQDEPAQPVTAVDKPGRRYPWPLMVIAAPAAVAVWSGWVGLGAMCGFGVVDLLPGIADLHINTAITLPVGIESYGAYALASWISGKGSRRTRTFAFRSAIGALALGCLGQVAFHLLAAAGWRVAPWPVVMAVACLPVVTLSFAAALVHLKRADAAVPPAGDEPAVRPREDKAHADRVDKKPDKRPGRQAGKPGPRVSTPPRTALDKAADAIRRHPDWTDAALAKSAGVSTKTVQRARGGISRGERRERARKAADRSRT